MAVQYCVSGTAGAGNSGCLLPSLEPRGRQDLPVRVLSPLNLHMLSESLAQCSQRHCRSIRTGRREETGSHVIAHHAHILPVLLTVVLWREDWGLEKGWGA